MHRLLIALALLVGLSVPAAAQSNCQYIATGAVLTAAQWNACFAAKQNTLNYVPVNKAGDAMLGRLTAAISTTLAAGFNLPPGSAPTSPSNGDLWTTTAGLFVRINGATVGPLISASGSTSIEIGVTPVVGTTALILYNNAGTLGGLASTGTGNVVRASNPTIAGLTVTSSFTATGLVTNASLANPSVTVNGVVCTLGSSCSPANIPTGGILGNLLYKYDGTDGHAVWKAAPTFMLVSDPAVDCTGVTASDTAFVAAFTNNTTVDASGCLVRLSASHTFASDKWLVINKGGMITSDAVSATASFAMNTFVASISTTTMTVSSLTTGTVVVGATLRGTGVNSSTTIVSQLTGSPGSTGTYQVSISQTAGSTTITDVSYSTMTVTAVGSSALALGDTVFHSSVGPNTKITALITGSGGTGTYTVLSAQTLGSTSGLSIGRTQSFRGWLRAGPYQTFTGAIVGFRDVYPDLWGCNVNGLTDDSDCISRADGSVYEGAYNGSSGLNSKIQMVNGTYAVSKPVYFHPASFNPLRVFGAGRTATCIKGRGAFARGIVYIAGALESRGWDNSDFDFRDFCIFHETVGQDVQCLTVGTPGNHVSGPTQNAIENLYFGNCLTLVGVYEARLIRWSRMALWMPNVANAIGVLIDPGNAGGTDSAEGMDWWGGQIVCGSPGSNLTGVKMKSTYNLNGVSAMRYHGHTWYFCTRGIWLQADGGPIGDLWVDTGSQIDDGTTFLYAEALTDLARPAHAITNINIDKLYTTSNDSNNAIFEFHSVASAEHNAITDVHITDSRIRGSSGRMFFSSGGLLGLNFTGNQGFGIQSAGLGNSLILLDSVVWGTINNNTVAPDGIPGAVPFWISCTGSTNAITSLGNTLVGAVGAISTGSCGTSTLTPNTF